MISRYIVQGSSTGERLGETLGGGTKTVGEMEGEFVGAEICGGFVGIKVGEVVVGDNVSIAKQI